MRQPAQQPRAGRQQISSIISYTSPVGGLNARDSIADMPPTDALTLTNWFPRPNYCEIRGGYASHATGMTGTGKTLLVYNGVSGTSAMFCATASGVYNVTSPGAVGASVAARTNGKHQWIMFGDGTSNWMIACNGADKPLYYDGTTWTAVDGASSPALTGITTTNLIAPIVHKGRLMFIEKNSLSFWYLTAGAAGGALTEFDLSGVAQRGGFLMAAHSWTVDSGNGPDDRMVFITSEGEIIVYAGTNPASSTAWGLVGIYHVGVPLGRNCTCRVGSDLVILTQQGAFPLTAILQESGINYALAVSNKIENLFNNDARTYLTNFGWKSILYPTQSAFIVNVPVVEDGEHIQYVMNTITKSWCKFTGWNAEDLAILDEQLYFCSGTAVYKAWSGTSDNNANIDASAKTAFSYFGNKVQQKRFSMFRPILATNGNIAFLADIDVDFKDKTITGIASTFSVSGATWDSSTWDNAYWSAGMEITREWHTPGEWTGYCAAGKIKIATKSYNVQWMSNDYVFESGGVL